SARSPPSSHAAPHEVHDRPNASAQNAASPPRGSRPGSSGAGAEDGRRDRCVAVRGYALVVMSRSHRFVRFARARDAPDRGWGEPHGRRPAPATGPPPGARVPRGQTPCRVRRRGEWQGGGVTTTPETSRPANWAGNLTYSSAAVEHP